MINNYMFWGGLSGALIFFVLALVWFGKTGYFVMSGFRSERRKSESKKKSRKRPKEKSDKSRASADYSTEVMPGGATELLPEDREADKKEVGKTDILYSREGTQEFRIEYRKLCIHTDESIGD